MRARPDDAGPNEPDFPEECPVCGAPNCTDEGDMLDASYLTCGKPDCIAKMERLEAEDRAADNAQHEQWQLEEQEALDHSRRVALQDELRCQPFGGCCDLWPDCEHQR